MPMDSNPRGRLVMAGIAIALLAAIAAVVGVLLGLMGLLVGVILVVLGVVMMADALMRNPLTATAIAGVVGVLVGNLGPNLDVQGLATRASSAFVSAKIAGQAYPVLIYLGLLFALFLLGLCRR